MEETLSKNECVAFFSTVTGLSKNYVKRQIQEVENGKYFFVAGAFIYEAVLEGKDIFLEQLPIDSWINGKFQYHFCRDTFKFNSEKEIEELNKEIFSCNY